MMGSIHRFIDRCGYSPLVFNMAKRFGYISLILLVVLFAVLTSILWINSVNFIPGSYVVKYEKFGEYYEVACRDYHIAEDNAVVTAQGYWDKVDNEWVYIDGVIAMYSVVRISANKAYNSNKSYPLR